MKKLENNIQRVALIFEGGGMRAAFSSGIANSLLEAGLYFNYVAGISAGTSLLVNYLSRDPDRARRSFIDIVDDPQFGGWRTFFKGQGFFNSDYIYDTSSRPDGNLAMDLETFMANPAHYRMVAYDMNEGHGKVFTEKDVHGFEDVSHIARASSSLPILMPPTLYKGHEYCDGGLTGGIPVQCAIDDGFDAFFIVRTREKAYRKKPVSKEKALRRLFKKHPLTGEAIINRPALYNKLCDQMEALEASGRAYVVYPDVMELTNRERNKEKLIAAYEQGLAIGRRDLPKWRVFIEKKEKEAPEPHF